MKYGLTIAAVALSIAGTTAGNAAEPLVGADWLEDRLGNQELVVLDIRNKLDGGSRETYSNGHIPGAVHSDYLLDGWRTQKGDVVGVLPDVAVLEALISDLGIGEDHHVVISHGGVDNTDFGSAARVYWTFKYLGHNQVSILDGGWLGWLEDRSRPVEQGIVERDGELFVAEIRPELLVGTDEVKGSLDQTGILRVDARPLDQFLGLAKHAAAKAFGRIPGAVQVDQSDFFKANGRLKDVDALRVLFDGHIGAGERGIFAYCNTGHWAATNWFVLSELLGVDNVRLYDHSMVGWTADPNLPVEREEATQSRHDQVLTKTAG